MKELKYLDIVISIYNQEKLIERVLYGIFNNTTTPFTLILVFDGCTDRTKTRAMGYIEKSSPPNLKSVVIRESPNVYETRANNIGYRLVKSDFFITIQDDMVVHEYGWDRRMIAPLRAFDDVLAVGARIAHDIDVMDENNQLYKNSVGRERRNLDREGFVIRDVINRGPIAFRTDYIKKLGYLNESYAPSDLDDADLCLRAWQIYGWKVGVIYLDVLSRLEWGKARAKDSSMNAWGNSSRNQARLGRDHKEYIRSNIKHSETRILDDEMIDYLPCPIMRKYYIYPVRFDLVHFYKLVRKTLSNITVLGVSYRFLKKLLLFGF